MKSYKLYYTTIFSGICMLIIILDGKTALQGASDGVALCVQTVIPSLFPFIFLSMFLCNGLSGLRMPILRPIERFCRIPYGSSPLLLTGLLGGYPVGAKCITDAVTNGQLTQQDARRMLGFCNNAGPAFIFGIGSSIFNNPLIPWVVWIIQIISTLLTAHLLSGASYCTSTPSRNDSVSLRNALQQSISTITSICGWVLLFRVIITFLERWISFFMPKEVFLILCGVLELSNGCLSLPQISSIPLQTLLYCIFINLGGLCVALQTVSVTGNLGTGLYFPGKLLQCLISSFGIIVYMQMSTQKLLTKTIYVAIIPLLLLFTVFHLYYKKKRYSNL